MASPKIGEKRELSPANVPLVNDKKPRSQSPITRDTEHRMYVTRASHAPDNSKSTTSDNMRKGEKKRRRKLINIEPCSHDDVYWHEIVGLLGKDKVQKMIEEENDTISPFEFHEEVELTISRLSSNGEGLAVSHAPRRPWVVIVPFSLPGERVRVRIHRNARLHSFADFLNLEESNSSLRDMSRVKCRYFGSCGGCQYQMLSYETQLGLKRDVVARAYESFSNLPTTSIPSILPTAPSPLQYAYRTKITPHFDAPVRGPRRQRGNTSKAQERLPEGTTVPVGFNIVGKRKVIDIEECPIATSVINEALTPVRETILVKLHTYKKGVSLLLRDSLEKIPESEDPSTRDTTPALPAEKHVCITDHRGKVRERVGDMLFEYGASSFFQNNNSILVTLVDYVRETIFSEASRAMSRSTVPPSPTHLVDTYCGAGLFSIMLSPYFSKIAGIELSTESIAAATHNAKLNNLPEGKVTFRSGDATNIFLSVPDFPPDSTAVIVDPPRKGCDETFLDQLLLFRSSTVVYVSCNVHTQARDVGILLRKSAVSSEKGVGLGQYVLESVRGFDLFPQTAHVESVAVLRLMK